MSNQMNGADALVEMLKAHGKYLVAVLKENQPELLSAETNQANRRAELVTSQNTGAFQNRCGSGRIVICTWRKVR